MVELTDNDRAGENVTRFPDKRKIKEEAGAWLIRFDKGELSMDEASQFQDWIKRSEFHRDYMEKLARNWDSMAILENLADLFPLPESGSENYGDAIGVETVQKPSLASRLSFSFSSPALLVPGLASCILLLVFFFSQQQLTRQEFFTAVGETSDFQLEDGSRVVLNTDSRISVDYSGDLRIVRLLKGEANFIVSRIPSRPFAVYAGNGLVWAVGTVFNVRNYNDMVDVTVTEGTVKVYTEVSYDKPLPELTTRPTEDAGTAASGSEAIVNAGQSLKYKKRIQLREVLVPEVLERKLAWQQGALIFKGETLQQVLVEISRYTDKKLIITDPAIKDIRIGGHFKTDDIDGLLITLSQGFGINVEQVSESSIHLSKNKTLL